MPIILFSSNDLASSNIAQNLINLGLKKISENEWELPENAGKLIDTKVKTMLEVPTDFNTDYLIILSPHRSKDGKPRLTAHTPGNWDSADFGGAPRTLNLAYGTKLAELIKQIKSNAEENKLDFEVVLEVDHHGPTCNLPIIFVEIGSSEKEWKNELAGKVISRAVFNSLAEKEKKTKVVFGIGGGHYAKEFTELILNQEIAVGHILPKYKIEGLAEDTFKQAIEKNVEKVDEVLALNTLNRQQKNKIMLLCEKFGVKYSEYKVD